jgi:hypothetical protein
VPDVSAEEWKKSDAYVVSFSEDGRTIAKRGDVVVPKKSGFDDVVVRLVETEFLALFDETVMRAMAMKDGRFARVLSLAEPLIPPFSDEIRIENIPDDQRALDEDEGLVQAVVAGVSSSEYLSVAGVPFLLKVKKKGTLGDVKETIFGILGVEGEAKAQARFFLGFDYVRFARIGQLADTDPIYNEDLKKTLYVVLDAKKPVTSRARPKQEALHIYN